MSNSVQVQRQPTVAGTSAGQAGAGAGGHADLKASLRGLSFEAQSAALSPGPVQKKEGGDGHAHDAPAQGQDANPTTGDSATTPERKSGESVPSDVRVKLMNKLAEIPRVKETLDAIEKAGKKDFPLKWSDAGTFHSAGTVYLRSTSTEESWIGSMAHELVHLQTFVEGKAADAKKQGRDEFVKAKMDDEINAHTATYISLLQSGGSSGAAGFSEFKTLVEKDHKALLDGKKWAELQAIARTFLEKKYKDEFTTNTSGENYYEYWGKHWDKVNKKTP